MPFPIPEYGPEVVLPCLAFGEMKSDPRIYIVSFHFAYVGHCVLSHARFLGFCYR